VSQVGNKYKSIKLVVYIHFHSTVDMRMIKPKPLLAPENWIVFFL